jgi:hypothetical protein
MNYTQLDDPDLFGECRHVRAKLECLPAHHSDRTRLTAVLKALTDEFDRRARDAWAPAAKARQA